MATRAEWMERVRGCERSGLELSEFARREGLDAKRLSWWRWRLRSDGDGKTAEPEFLPVRVVNATPPPTGTAIEIVLPNGRLVRVRPGFDDATLLRVLGIVAEQEDAC